MVVKFSKQGIQPDPREVDYWIDISTDPYGSVVKYFNGVDWVDLVADGETGMSPFDYYTKEQVNQMINTKADVGSVDSKVDDTEIENLIQDIDIKSIGNNTVQLIVVKHNNTKVGLTLPIASNTSSGIITAADFMNFVKQHQLQSLYTQMYDLFADIREKYQPRLKAGKNITIDRTTNTISASGQISVDWNQITNKPEIPNKTSQLVNDSGYVTTVDIANTKAELKADIAAVDDKVTANTQAIAVLNGTGEGSVRKQVSDAITSIVDGAPEALDTLKEISDYIASDKEGAAEMSNAIAANKTAIETETKRATQKEEQLLSRIVAIEDGTSVDYVTEGTLNSTVQQLTAADADIISDLNTEIAERKAAIEEVSEVANNAATKDQLAAEITKVTEVTTQNTSDIENLKGVATVLTSDLQQEVARATNVEDKLQKAIDTEEERATEKETELSTAISNESSRATAEETKIREEFAAADAANLTTVTTNINSVNTKLTQHISAYNSKVEEIGATTDTLDTKISEEIARAEDAEKTLTDNLNTEINRATEAEETLQTNLETEIATVNSTLTSKYYTSSAADVAIEKAIAVHNEDETAHESIRNSVTLVNSIATNAQTQSSEAVDTAYEFAQVAAEAKTTAEAARNAIASLEGLTDVDTSALTTAELIAQVEQNAADIQALKDRDVVLGQSVFDTSTEKDVTKHYFIYDDSESA